MTTTSERSLAHAVMAGAPSSVTERFLAQQILELQQKVAELQKEVQDGLDEVFALAASASLDSATTKRQLGLGKDAWLEARG